MALDMNSLMNRLIPLFEAKLNYQMQAQDRMLSLEEKKEQNKTELEYAKLNGQLKGDQDKLKWEKEKTTLGFKHGMDLQTLANQGHIDLTRLQQAGAKDVAEIQASAARYGHDIDAIPKLLTAGAGQVVKNADGSETTVPKSKEATGIASRLSSNLGLAEPAKPAAGQTDERAAVTGQAYAKYNDLMQKDPAKAQQFLSTLKATNPELHAGVSQFMPQAPAAATGIATSPAAQSQTVAQQVTQPAIGPRLPAQAQREQATAARPETLGLELAGETRPSYGLPSLPKPVPGAVNLAGQIQQPEAQTPAIGPRQVAASAPPSVGAMNLGGTIPPRPAMQPGQLATADEEEKKRRSKLLNSNMI